MDKCFKACLVEIPTCQHGGFQKRTYPKGVGFFGRSEGAQLEKTSVTRILSYNFGLVLSIWRKTIFIPEILPNLRSACVGGYPLSDGIAAPRRFAVLVGVNSYAGSNAPDLSYCANDAEAVYDALVHYAHYSLEDVVLFSDGEHAKARKPRYTDILSEIKSMCVRASDQDSIVFFFAGHGTRDDQDSYLLTQEFRYNVLADSSISMKRVNEYYDSSKAKFKMRFFDACHSGRMGIRGLPNPDVSNHLTIDAEGWATLAACTEDQFAHELAELGHGVFSYFLVRGLAGEASTDSKVVTLDSLKVYVMDRIIDLTRKRGLEQTPVFRGEQAGSLILVSSPQPNGDLPTTLAQIKGFETSTLEPAPTQTDTYLADLRTLLDAKHGAAAFVSPSQETKVDLIQQLYQGTVEWAKAEAERGSKAISGSAAFEVESNSLLFAPLNSTLAEFLFTSKVKRSIEATFRTEWDNRVRRERKRLSPIEAFSFAEPQYVEVPYSVEVAKGIVELEGNPKASVYLIFRPTDHLAAQCALAISFIPSTFGVYMVAYFAATRLAPKMVEDWDAASFSMRLFEALEISNPNIDELVREQLDQVHSEFVSYISERVQTRRAELVKLGAGPEPLL